MDLKDRLVRYQIGLREITDRLVALNNEIQKETAKRIATEGAIAELKYIIEQGEGKTETDDVEVS
jgi:hypothetical protein